MALEIGMQREDPFTVEDGLVTDVGGTIGARVLSTPGMIGMMERSCSMLAFENLPEGQATVGFEVHIRHVAAAAEGSECVAICRLEEIVEDRKFRFAVEVREGERTLGVGTHERRLVDFGQLAGD